MTTRRPSDRPSHGPPARAAGWLAAALAAALASGSAVAADACLGSADEATLLACRQHAYADASQRLRQAVDQLRRRYADDEPERAALLAAAQQAWRGYQEAECRFRHAESASGRAYQAYLLSCLTDLSERRLQDLRGVLATP